MLWLLEKTGVMTVGRDWCYGCWKRLVLWLLEETSALTVGRDWCYDWLAQPAASGSISRPWSQFFTVKASQLAGK